VINQTKTWFSKIVFFITFSCQGKIIVEQTSVKYCRAEHGSGSVGFEPEKPKPNHNRWQYLEADSDHVTSTGSSSAVVSDGGLTFGWTRVSGNTKIARKKKLHPSLSSLAPLRTLFSGFFNEEESIMGVEREIKRKLEVN
jgi:hypothetical protein